MVHPALEQGEGILRLAPTWVPRTPWVPGRRLRLHPNDLYAYGAHRGGIDERWFASTTKADNGPLTTPDEGLSFAVYGDESRPRRALLKDLVGEAGSHLLGDQLWREYGGWPVFAKFFDNQGALPFHMHQMAAHAQRVGAQPKPEAYYFPAQMNNYPADFPYTFFGLEPGTTQDQIRHCLEMWDLGDNHILDLSRAFRLEIGTGWYLPAGLLHAPGSLCTYEPQWGSDVYAMFQSLVGGIPLDRDVLVHNVPPDHTDDLDYVISMLDWEGNLNPHFKATHFRRPQPVRPIEEMEADGYRAMWITYGNPYFAAQELTVLPGRTAIVKDAAAYGLIMVEGHGTLNASAIETAGLIRFGQLTHDEYFVSCQTARAGVTIHNPSRTSPLVMLKHFGPDHDAPR